MSKLHDQKKMEAAAAHHRNMCQHFRQTYVGKLCLVGIQSQGGAIERTFVTDLKGDNEVGLVAMRLCAENTEDGMYFPLQDLRIYHIYDEAETAKHVEKYQSEKALKPAQPAVKP